MSGDLSRLEGLCDDSDTLEEAKKLLRLARDKTKAGSGFDLGQVRTCLPAICAFLASESLNNTDVSFEAAQLASCQPKAQFEKYVEQVKKAIGERKRARREPLKYQELLPKFCPKVSVRAIVYMHKAEARLLESEECSDDMHEDHITCAIFAWVCNTVKGIKLVDSSVFTEEYRIAATSLRPITKVIDATCADLKDKFATDYVKVGSPTKAAASSPTKRVLRSSRGTNAHSPDSEEEVMTSPTKRMSVSPHKSPSKAIRAAKDPKDTVNTRAPPAKTPVPSPRKSPSKPVLRALPSRDSPQKRTVSFPDETQSPAKKQKTASSSLVTLESIRQAVSSSKPPPETPSTPRKSQRLAASPSTSPAKLQPLATPSRRQVQADVVPMDVDDAPSSAEDEDFDPPPRRRFRPVFLDQKQWAAPDPRLAKLTKLAEAHMKRMVGACGTPFADYRRAVDSEDVEMDSD